MLSSRIANLLVAVALAPCIFAQDYQPQSVLTLPREDEPPRISLDLELPRVEAPLPFYAEETESPEVAYPPVPAEELTPPRELWNPANDPAFFYAPIVQEQQQQREEAQAQEEAAIKYPKKYIKELHVKEKPSNYKNLDLSRIEKILYNLAKNENRANLQKEQRRQVNRSSDRQTDRKPPINKKSLDEESIDSETVDGSARDSVPSASFESHRRPSSSPFAEPSGERMQFQMHGFKGPKSYKWGYDTGKGYNRHFRYEERDSDGLVKGQYGYHDKNGKLRVFNYHSHPRGGFHAEEESK